MAGGARGWLGGHGRVYTDNGTCDQIRRGVTRCDAVRHRCGLPLVALYRLAARGIGAGRPATTGPFPVDGVGDAAGSAWAGVPGRAAADHGGYTGRACVVSRLAAAQTLAARPGHLAAVAGPPAQPVIDGGRGGVPGVAAVGVLDVH